MKLNTVSVNVELEGVVMATRHAIREHLVNQEETVAQIIASELKGFDIEAAVRNQARYTMDLEIKSAVEEAVKEVFQKLRYDSAFRETLVKAVMKIAKKQAEEI
jgi:uncharacterized membrane-anchored protein YjiN (DUF445 family)